MIGLLSPKQAEFLTWFGREALYGGAAGGGKSFALLMGALQFVHRADYHALILRRTYKQLSLSEALIPISHEWLSDTDAVWNGDNYRWTFPSGATLTFGHMEHEKSKYDYQGAGFRYVAFDELTQFTETQYRYLFSRTRRRAGDREPIPVRIRAASNPGGIGHDWVKARFIDRKPTRGRRFFPALMTDNLGLDQEEYRGFLAELPELERHQLEHGDWDAVAGGRFNTARIGRFRWLPRAPGEPYGVIELPSGKRFSPWQRLRLQTVDPATTENEKNDPTVDSTFCTDPTGEYLCWLGCLRDWIDLPDILPALEAEQQKWKASEVGIESVAANNAVYKFARRTPLPIRKLSPAGKDKLVRAFPAIAWVDAGRVLVPQNDPAFPLDAVLGELGRFTGIEGQDAHDDIVDTLSYVCERLSQMGNKGGGKPAAAGRVAAEQRQRQEELANADVGHPQATFRRVGGRR